MLKLSDWRISLGIVAAIIASQAVVLHRFGQPAFSTSGKIMLWAGDVLGPENSQQLSDWYSFSHIIHGFLFYCGLWFFFPRLSVWQRLTIAVGIEVAWEITENTPVVIQHYREQALAQGYTGDSVINSVSDTIMMIVGFFIARSAPVSATIAAALGMELFTGYFIRDGLTLNVLNLIHQFDFIKQWQTELR
jgi:hypothetical protein